MDDARPDVSTLLARTPAAAPALIGVLAGWRTVTRTVRVPLLAGYVVSAVLPLERAAERSGQVGCTGRSMAQAGLAGGNGDPAALDLLASGAPAQLLDYF